MEKETMNRASAVGYGFIALAIILFDDILKAIGSLLIALMIMIIDSLIKRKDEKTRNRRH